MHTIPKWNRKCKVQKQGQYINQIHYYGYCDRILHLGLNFYSGCHIKKGNMIYKSQKLIKGKYQFLNKDNLFLNYYSYSTIIVNIREKTKTFYPALNAPWCLYLLRKYPLFFLFWILVFMLDFPKMYPVKSLLLGYDSKTIPSYYNLAPTGQN